MRQAGAAARDLRAIAITNQRETTLLWDRRSGKPFGRAIVWQDRRTADRCEKLRADGLGQTVQDLTGLIVDPYFCATKIAWILDRYPQAREGAQRGEIAFGTVDSWLIWKLTGGRRHVTDITNASRTMLFDIHACDWSEPLLQAFGIPRSLLPQVLPCTADFGDTQAELFGAAVPICGVAGDQHAALAGQTCFEPGLAKITYGTGAFAMLNTGPVAARSTSGCISTIAFAFDRSAPVFALEGSVFNTGTAVQWLRDGLQIIENARDIEALARSCEHTGGLAFVPAFTGLGAPYWDPNARGVMVGITRGTTRAHLARAVLEAIAFQCADVVAAMERDAGIRLTELRVDGGGSRNALAMQLQADLLGLQVVRPVVTETTAMGAAFFAGLQCGLWPDLDALRALWREDARFTAQIAHSQRAALTAQWYRAVERSRNWAQ